MFYLFVMVHPCCDMFQYHTRKLRLYSCLTPRSVSLLFPLSLFLRQCFPSFLYLICRLSHDDSVTNSIPLDLVPGYVQCCRKGICYIARADITRYFLMLRPAARRTEVASRHVPVSNFHAAVNWLSFYHGIRYYHDILMKLYFNAQEKQMHCGSLKKTSTCINV